MSFLLPLLLHVHLVAVVGFVVFQLDHRVDLGPAQLVEVVPAGLIAAGQRVHHGQRVPLQRELPDACGPLGLGQRNALQAGGVGAANAVELGKKKSVSGSASRNFTAPQSCSTSAT